MSNLIVRKLRAHSVSAERVAAVESTYLCANQDTISITCWQSPYTRADPPQGVSTAISPVPDGHPSSRPAYTLFGTIDVAVATKHNLAAIAFTAFTGIVPALAAPLADVARPPAALGRLVFILGVHCPPRRSGQRQVMSCGAEVSSTS